MKQIAYLLGLLVLLVGCSVATPEPTPIPPTATPAPPKALSLFVEKAGMTQEQAEEALKVLNSVGIDDIKNLEFPEKDVPGMWYTTEFEGFTDAKIYVSGGVIKKITDSKKDMMFYNTFTKGVIHNAKDFLLMDSEVKFFIGKAKEYVLQGLKVPTSAVFPDSNTANWKVARYEHYVQVESTVDAQNSFGVMVTSSFLLQMDYVNQKLIYMKLGDQVTGERTHWRVNE